MCGLSSQGVNVAIRPDIGSIFHTKELFELHLLTPSVFVYHFSISWEGGRCNPGEDLPLLENA